MKSAALGYMIAGPIGVGIAAAYEALRHRRLAVIGPSMSGKTKLQRFLRNGRVDETYRRTLNPEDMPGAKFRLEDLKFNVARGTDVGGTQVSLSSWVDVIKRADAIIFVFNAKRVHDLDRDYIELLETQITNTRVISDDRPLWFTTRRLVLVGTHMDLLRGDEVELHATILGQLTKVLACGDAVAQDVVLGSLDDDRTRSALGYQLVTRLKKKASS